MARHHAFGMEIWPWSAYAHVMSNTANRAAAPAKWLESLARSKAEIASGRTVPLLPILDRLRASAERLEAAKDRPPDGARKTAEE